MISTVANTRDLILDLQHVPCKFFRQGACTAGQNCPFSHSLEPEMEMRVCKYFQRGNCKFGARCALAHVLPNGRRVNHSSLLNSHTQQQQQQQQQHRNGSLQLGNRIEPTTVGGASALHSGLLQLQDDDGENDRGEEDEGRKIASPKPIRPLSDALPTALSSVGSKSPTRHLPGSVDTDAIGYIARTGPLATSVPNNLFLDSSSTLLMTRANEMMANNGKPHSHFIGPHTTAHSYVRQYGNGTTPIYNHGLLVAEALASAQSPRQYSFDERSIASSSINGNNNFIPGSPSVDGSPRRLSFTNSADVHRNHHQPSHHHHSHYLQPKSPLSSEAATWRMTPLTISTTNTEDDFEDPTFEEDFVPSSLHEEVFTMAQLERRSLGKTPPQSSGLISPLTSLSIADYSSPPMEDQHQQQQEHHHSSPPSHSLRGSPSASRFGSIFGMEVRPDSLEPIGPVGDEYSKHGSPLRQELEVTQPQQPPQPKTAWRNTPSTKSAGPPLQQIRESEIVKITRLSSEENDAALQKALINRIKQEEEMQFQMDEEA